nr:MAG TPA: DNA polymerase B [Caudoviricetes sp.]
MQNLTKISQQEFDPLPKILCLDIESSPSLIWAYSLWNANAVKVERDPTIMSISWQWVDMDKTRNLNLSSMSEEELARHIWDLYNQADYVLGHNSNKFDNKMINALFMRYGLTPPSPYKQIDTLQVARSVARFNSNRLDSLGKLLLGEGKTETTYKDLWYDCLVKNDKKSWAQMVEYNNRDVDVTVALYKKLRPWIKNHPNIGDHTGIDGICPKCGSDNIRKDGSYRKRSGRVQRYKCLHCGGWSSEASVKKEGRLVNV